MGKDARELETEHTCLMFHPWEKTPESRKLHIKKKLREVTCATFSAYIMNANIQGKDRQYPIFDYWWMHLIRTMAPRERFENVYALDEATNEKSSQKNVQCIQTINPDRSIGKQNVHACIFLLFPLLVTTHKQIRSSAHMSSIK